MGAAGLGAASAAHDLGLSRVVLDANHLAETVHAMTKGKRIFAEPESVENESGIWFEECTREELLERWTDRMEQLGLDVRTREEVEHIERDRDRLVVTSTKGVHRTRRVVLAASKALCDHKRVTLVTIDPEFLYPKNRNVEAVRAKAAEGRLEL